MDANLIRGPIGVVIGIIVWLVVFPLLIGSINGWFTQSVSAGIVSGERFDRVVVAVSNNVEDAWDAVTAADPNGFSIGGAAGDHTPSATTAFNLVEESGECKVGVLNGYAAASGDATTISAQTYYTPLGSKVTSAPASADRVDSGDVNTADITISGCRWSEAGSVFGAGGLGGLVELILQAAGLAPPIGVLMIIGSFGQSFMNQIGNRHPILAAVIASIGLLLVATLLNVFVPFLDGAFDAIDSNRFVMYTEGLGSLASVIGNFYGVTAVASMLMIGWQVIKQMRGGDAISNAQRM